MQNGAFDQNHIKVIENRKSWSWEKNVKYEIKQQHKNPVKLRETMQKLNIEEARLRDVRDEQCKLVY